MTFLSSSSYFHFSLILFYPFWNFCPKILPNAPMVPLSSLSSTMYQLMYPPPHLPALQLLRQARAVRIAHLIHPFLPLLLILPLFPPYVLLGWLSGLWNSRVPYPSPLPSCQPAWTPNLDGALDRHTPLLNPSGLIPLFSDYFSEIWPLHSIFEKLSPGFLPVYLVI